VGDVFGVVIAILVAAITLIAHLVAKVKEAQQAAARRDAARRFPQRPVSPENVPKPSQAASPQGTTSDEIEEFLRRSRKAQRQDAPGRRAQQQPSPQRSAPSVQPLRTPAGKTAEAPIAATLVDPADRGASVADHVQHRMTSPKFGQVGSQLGQEVVQENQQFEQRLQSVFHHQVSQLANVGGEAAKPQNAELPTMAADRVAAAPAVAASNLAALFGDPTTLRQVILIGEILHRPEERWL
jgi:hypothetical protein